MATLRTRSFPNPDFLLDFFGKNKEIDTRVPKTKVDILIELNGSNRNSGAIASVVTMQVPTRILNNKESVRSPKASFTGKHPYLQ